MNAFKLHYPLCTLDNKQLLPAGTLLEKDTLESLSLLSTTSNTMSILKFGSIKSDIEDFLCQPPYNIIFSDSKQIAFILDFIEETYISLPVLECLDYFKQNDFYTYRHMLMVFILSILLSQELIKDKMDLAIASPSHDFGKIYIPLEILKKKEPLTLKDKETIEQHTLAGFVLLRYYIQNKNNLAARIARDHHERINGSGYPFGIHLKDPMIEIIVICDIYDALISPRPYRMKPYDNRTALEEICSQGEIGKLNWDVIKTLISFNRKNKPHYSKCNISKKKRETPPANNLYGVIATDETDSKD